jgi:hypothetical protein
MQTDIHALRWIRTHDPSVREGEFGSCLRPRGHCDRPHFCHQPEFYSVEYVAMNTVRITQTHFSLRSKFF